MIKLFKYLPVRLKKYLVRSLLSTKNVKQNSNLETRLASTLADYRKAFSLLHDCYVAKGLMEPHSSGMRCSVHSFLPHNRVIVVVDKNTDEVVGTVSLILDNSMGLPAESEYLEEVDVVRRMRKGKLIEVSALAIDKKYRNQAHAIQFMLNKYLYLYCRDILKASMYCIVIHPKAELFYSALMEFKALGEIIEYKFVKGALARFMFLDLSGSFESDLGLLYSGKKNSFYDYVVQQNDNRLIFDKESEDKVVTRNVSIMLELIKESAFQVDKLDDFEKSHLLTGLNLTPDNFDNINLSKIVSSYRFDSHLSAIITKNNISEIKKLANISTQGAFVESTLENVTINQQGIIQFQWRGELFKAPYKVIWINQSLSHKLQSGFGIQFIGATITIFTKDEDHLAA